MLYIIGTGLNMEGISKEGVGTLRKCKRVYIENYTVNFPYDIEDLSKKLEKELIPANRDFVESLSILKEAKDEEIALLVYGNPLMATTHITLVEECKKANIKYKILHSASILDAVGETGLQIYKFGKITSIPGFEADSYGEIIKENQSINAHSLILVDIGLEYEKALERLKKSLEKYKINSDKIIVCYALGTEHSKIYYDSIKDLKTKEIGMPFCFIIPGKMHFMEKEFLKNL